MAIAIKRKLSNLFRTNAPFNENGTRVDALKDHQPNEQWFKDMVKTLGSDKFKSYINNASFIADTTTIFNVGDVVYDGSNLFFSKTEKIGYVDINNWISILLNSNNNFLALAGGDMNDSAIVLFKNLLLGEQASIKSGEISFSNSITGNIISYTSEFFKKTFGLFNTIVNFNNPTSNNVISFPNSSGTLALVSIPTESLYVDNSQTVNGNGSITSPFNNLQSALDISTENQTINLKGSNINYTTSNLWKAVNIEGEGNSVIECSFDLITLDYGTTAREYFFRKIKILCQNGDTFKVNRNPVDSNGVKLTFVDCTIEIDNRDIYNQSLLSICAIDFINCTFRSLSNFNSTNNSMFDVNGNNSYPGSSLFFDKCLFVQFYLPVFAFKKTYNIFIKDCYVYVLNGTRPVFEFTGNHFDVNINTLSTRFTNGDVQYFSFNKNGVITTFENPPVFENITSGSRGNTTCFNFINIATNYTQPINLRNCVGTNDNIISIPPNAITNVSPNNNYKLNNLYKGSVGFIRN